MWMSPGSYWTQPRGANHITSAGEHGAMALVEISEGPYLVMPSGEAFDSGEQPINVDSTNLVWQNFAELGWNPADSRVAMLSHEMASQSRWMFLELSTSSDQSVLLDADSLRVVVVSGTVPHRARMLEAGSYLGAEGAIDLACAEACRLYVHSEGNFVVRAI